MDFDMKNAKVKEVCIEKGGLNSTLEIDGEKVKFSNFENTQEVQTAHDHVCAMICEHFFEICNMAAKDKGVNLCEVFQNQDELDNAMKEYITSFIKLLTFNAVAQSQANGQLFKKQREALAKKRAQA